MLPSLNKGVTHPSFQQATNDEEIRLKLITCTRGIKMPAPAALRIRAVKPSLLALLVGFKSFKIFMISLTSISRNSNTGGIRARLQSYVRSGILCANVAPICAKNSLIALAFPRSSVQSLILCIFVPFFLPGQNCFIRAHFFLESLPHLFNWSVKKLRCNDFFNASVRFFDSTFKFS